MQIYISQSNVATQLFSTECAGDEIMKIGEHDLAKIWIKVCSSLFRATLYNICVCAADFGLAKQKRADCSRMNSVVGTILCSWYIPGLL